MAVVIIATVMIPIITATTQTTTTTEIENEGEGWLKLGYNEGADYSFNVGYETITVDEVETEIFKVGEQTGEYENMICYADPQRTLFISGDSWYLLTAGETPTVHKFTDTASVSNASGTLTINDGSTAIYSGASPNWAYVPDENGVYGFFTEGGLNLEEGKPTVAVGSYAGVFAYNDTVVAPNDLGNLGLTMSGDYSEGNVTWILVSEDESNETFNLSLESVDIQSINLGGDSNIGLMSADPTTGVRIGDLYYRVYTASGRNLAVVTGYSSEIDWSTFSGIPETVVNNDVTYTVVEIGSNALPGTQINVTSLPDTVKSIGSNAFNRCTNLSLTHLPDSLNKIDSSGFSACTNLTISYLPASLTKIDTRAFSGCRGIENLIVLSSPEIASNSFENTNVKEILNLGTNEITTTSYGLNADSVQDHVSAIGYIAPVSIHETVIVEDTSLSATLLKLLPVFMVLAVVIFIGYAMYRPDSEFVRSLKRRY